MGYEYIRIFKEDREKWEELSTKTGHPLTSLFRLALNLLLQEKRTQFPSSLANLLDGEETHLTIALTTVLKKALRVKAEELGVSASVLARVVLADFLSKPENEKFIEKILLFSSNRIRGPKGGKGREKNKGTNN